MENAFNGSLCGLSCMTDKDAWVTHCGLQWLMTLCQMSGPSYGPVPDPLNQREMPGEQCSEGTPVSTYRYPCTLVLRLVWSSRGPCVPVSRAVCDWARVQPEYAAPLLTLHRMFVITRIRPGLPSQCDLVSSRALLVSSQQHGRQHTADDHHCR